jgi:hypothetical protein
VRHDSVADHHTGEEAVPTADHHSAYLARAVAALTPEGRERVDQLLDQLAETAAHREWLVRFALARKAEADLGRPQAGAAADPGHMLTREALQALLAGFKQIRDQEPLDDVGDWANAVVALLQDDAAQIPG